MKQKAQSRIDLSKAQETTITWAYHQPPSPQTTSRFVLTAAHFFSAINPRSNLEVQLENRSSVHNPRFKTDSWEIHRHEQGGPACNVGGAINKWGDRRGGWFGEPGLGQAGEVHGQSNYDVVAESCAGRQKRRAGEFGNIDVILNVVYSSNRVRYCRCQPLQVPCRF